MESKPEYEGEYEYEYDYDFGTRASLESPPRFVIVLVLGFLSPAPNEEILPRNRGSLSDNLFLLLAALHGLRLAR
jgi:hypothetical protein